MPETTNQIGYCSYSSSSKMFPAATKKPFKSHLLHQLLAGLLRLLAALGDHLPMGQSTGFQIWPRNHSHKLDQISLLYGSSREQTFGFAFGYTDAHILANGTKAYKCKLSGVPHPYLTWQMRDVRHFGLFALQQTFFPGVSNGRPWPL